MELILTHDESSSTYAIICYNIRTYQSAGVVAVVRGQQNATAKVKDLEGSQSSTEQHEGWRYIFEKTTLKAGTDHTEATRKRVRARWAPHSPRSERPRSGGNRFRARCKGLVGPALACAL